MRTIRRVTVVSLVSREEARAILGIHRARQCSMMFIHLVCSVRATKERIPAAVKLALDGAQTESLFVAKMVFSAPAFDPALEDGGLIPGSLQMNPAKKQKRRGD